MKKIFFSYNFATATQSGFGDTQLEGTGVCSMDDIKQAKEHIKGFLTEEGHINPSVVIISWQHFDQEAA